MTPERIAAKGYSGKSKTSQGMDVTHGTYCQICNAWRGELGLEPTFNEYIEHLQTIFDEVYRILKKEGTCWVNVGDTYGGTGDKGNWRDPKYKEGRNGQAVAIHKRAPAKSLCNIPHRFAISMTSNKWIQRNTLIWWKPSCMPSSAKDRFTVDFEYVFFFTKNKKYYFEQQFDAYTEPLNRGGGDKIKDDFNTKYTNGQIAVHERAGRELRPNDRGRNRRAVWRINPQPFKDAHFAVFPEKLVEPMIQAGCPLEICDSCDTAYEHNYNFKYETARDGVTDKYRQSAESSVTRRSILNDVKSRDINKQIKKCNCNAPTHAGIVLDPFAGSGTTCLVARKLGRHYLGFDLNPDYVKMAEKRISEVL